MQDSVNVIQAGIDWTADDNIGVIYRKRAPTVADYDEAIADLQRAREAIATGDESRGCAVCSDSGHGVRFCHHNPLVAARAWVIERGKHRCYHCGFVALSDDMARDHFGRCEDEVAKCISERIRLSAPSQEVVEEACRRMAARDGLNWDEVCEIEADEEAECGSSTCVAAFDEDHRPDVIRSWYRDLAQAALSAKSGAA